MLIDGKQMHLQCTAKEIGRYVILPGDPGRCAAIAAFFDDAHAVSSNREFNVWTGFLDGEKVSVCSTGIGGPSAAIALEELVECGADTFIRVGTCGGVDVSVRGGDVVVATAAVRQEGTSREYLPLEYPAAASYPIVRALADACEALGFRTHVGVIQSKDSFYGEIRPQCMPIAAQLQEKWNAWTAAGVLASEMESAALFVAGACLHVRCGTVLNVLWNDESEAPAVPEGAAQRGIRAAVEAIRRLIREDNRS
ncbi:MAG: uridine phosphorylase [Butyricicoccus porcorum]|nr:uridine phosphorylase [Butyricicoccus porcorum]MDY4482791.1 uridine phosphorylase [Butyricicoccus porcorum]